VAPRLKRGVAARPPPALAAWELASNQLLEHASDVADVAAPLRLRQDRSERPFWGQCVADTAASVTASGRLGFDLSRLEACLEQAPDLLPGQLRPVPRPARLERKQLDLRSPAAVAAGIALGLGQRPQPSEHEIERTTAAGRRARR
jgi:hypothetical protein